MLLTELLKKTVINVNDAEELGKCENMLINRGILTHILCGGKCYSTADIVRISDFVAVVGKAVCSTHDALALIGNSVIYQSGKTAGKILDYQFNKAYKLNKIFTTKGGISAKRLIKCTEKIAVVSKNVPKPVKENDTLKTAAQSLPKDFNFLIGRRVYRSVYSSSGALLASENAIITRSILNAVYESGKLVELTLNSEKINEKH